MRFSIGVLCLLLPVSALAQNPTPKDVRLVAKDGQSAIPKLALYLNSPSVDTRIEVVKQLTELGGKDSLDPLIQATRDADPEMQMRAIDGLVNFYLPGYVKSGPAASLARMGSSIKAKFSDTNDQVIDGFVTVRPEVIQAIGKLASGGNGMDVRESACRAIGILRGRAALPDLYEALRTKDSDVMYEALVAIRKIRDPQAGPRIVYLLRDFNDKVQSTAIETAGVLQAKDGLPALRSIVASPRGSKDERAALTAIAMMPETGDRALLQRYLTSKDERLRAAAVEGLARIGDPGDKAAIEKVWRDDDKMTPRLASAFALTMEGNVSLAETSPFRYLLNTLNSSSWRDTASAYLVEAARKPEVLAALKVPLATGTRDEKIQLARILAVSGDSSAIPWLEAASRDSDVNVAQEGLRALRTLRARL
ncbi:MAG TPA: HEAT repeat domain-containing protein [Bryobacteraceae bacterium]|nr:HEAT repeat domain-containing protein [Bryobacteraceae bacterium]